jgi:hypothetical protein
LKRNLRLPNVKSSTRKNLPIKTRRTTKTRGFLRTGVIKISTKMLKREVRNERRLLKKTRGRPTRKLRL